MELCTFSKHSPPFAPQDDRARGGLDEHRPAREDPGGAVLVDHDERRHRRRGGHAGRARLLLGGAAAGAATAIGFTVAVLID